MICGHHRSSHFLVHTLLALCLSAECSQMYYRLCSNLSTALLRDLAKYFFYF